MELTGQVIVYQVEAKEMYIPLKGGACAICQKSTAFFSLFGKIRAQKGQTEGKYNEFMLERMTEVTLCIVKSWKPQMELVQSRQYNPLFAGVVIFAERENLHQSGMVRLKGKYYNDQQTQSYSLSSFGQKACHFPWQHGLKCSTRTEGRNVYVGGK